MDTRRARRFLQLTIQKRKLKAELAAIEAKLSIEEPLIMSDLINAQIKSETYVIDGEKMTLHLHTMLRARPKDGDKSTVVKVMKRCGLSGLVKEDYNTNTLDAWVRERLNSDSPKLPPTLENVLDLNEIVSVRGRRSPVSSESKTAKAIKTIRR